MKLRALSLVFALSLLGGCTGLLAPRNYSDAEFATLLSQHRFAAAQTYIARLRAADTSSARAHKLADQLRAAQAGYRKTVVEHAHKAQSRGDWHAAAGQWRDGLSLLPDDPVLEKGQAQFAAARKRRLETLESQLAELRADNLAHKIALTRELTDVAAKPARWRRMLSGYRQEALDLVPLLERRAYAAEKNGEWYRARDEYRRLSSLTPGAEFNKALERVNRHIAQKEDTVKQERQKRKRDRYRDVSQRFSKALASGDLPTAQKLLDRMRGMGLDRKAVAADAERLTGLIERRVEVLVERGRNEYTRGDLDAAINAWNQALKLEPDNAELKNRIERAQRFRDNVERLSR